MPDSAAPSAGGVFISYRHEETEWLAVSLFDRLSDRYGRGQVFKDVDSIHLGVDFIEAINSAVGSCAVLLALIGKQWLTITDEHGTARLNNPDDFVRLEIEAALTRDVRVIPILVAGAKMPRPDQLPPSLAKLRHRQALVELSPNHFEADISRLQDELDPILRDPRRRRWWTRRRITIVALAGAVAVAAGALIANLVGHNGTTAHPPATSSTTAHPPAASGTTAQTSTPSGTALNGPTTYTFTRTLTYTGGVRSVAFSRDGILATGSKDGITRLWNVSSGAQLRHFPQSPPPGDHNVFALAFKPDGRVLATGSDDGTIQLWNPSTGAPLLNTPLTGGTPVKALAFSPDGGTLVSAGVDGWLHFWDTSTWKPIGTFQADNDEVEGLAFSPDGTILATGSWDHTVKLWDAAIPHQQIGPTLTGHTDHVLTVAFSHDGTILASASPDKTVRLWNVPKHDSPGQPLSHTGPVIGVAFSPNENILASAGFDHTVRLWDAATGKPVGNPLGGGNARFTGVAFSPDGKFLAAGSVESSVWIWTATPGTAGGSTTR